MSSSLELFLVAGLSDAHGARLPDGSSDVTVVNGDSYMLQHGPNHLAR
jgi:hypothetical protein